ncbi:MAG: DUF433 domain-containing protein [Thermomicrobium sp.]|nr:DUF433 domain-containing protein [Thermomicrobium sp.]MDW8007928.1 DUF433 domain-containing protein [Thermomicrobium sp.]
MTGEETHRWHEQIAIDEAVLAGKPVIRGTRIAVEQVLDVLAAGWTIERLLDEFPGLTEADVRACLAYAADVLRSERVYPVPR